MVLRLLLALLFTMLIVIGSSVIVYRGWQINNPGAPAPDVQSLIKSPEQVTNLASKLTTDDILAALTAVVTGEPQGKPQAMSKTLAPAPVVAAAAPAPAPAPKPAPPVVVAESPKAPVASVKTPAAPPPAVAAPELSPELRIATDLTPKQKGCVVGGAAGTGAALVVGPTEVAAFATGAVVPATARVIGTVIGSALVAGCAAGYLVAPSLDW